MAISHQPDSRVIAACEASWDVHKSNCSGFAKAVATDLGIALSGQANDIVRSVRDSWKRAADGVEAADRAAEGKFVIGGLESPVTGHVVVVVPGALAIGKYPRAYWGRLNGVGAKNETINWSWTAAERDLVEYHYCDVAT